jgi:hypothetical protein
LVAENADNFCWIDINKDAVIFIPFIFRMMQYVFVAIEVA